MRLLEKLFQIISNIAPSPKLSEKEAEMLARLNPDKFYIENVRSILGVSHAAAAQICEAAVRQGVFERHVEVKHRGGRMSAWTMDFFDQRNREIEMERAERIIRLQTGRGMTPRAARIVVDAAMYGIGCTEGEVRARIEKEKHDQG